MPTEPTPNGNAARVQELEHELEGIQELITRINQSLAAIDPEDIDRLTEEGGRRAILVRRKQEIEAELASIRSEPGAPSSDGSPPILSCQPVVTGVSLNSIAFTPDGTMVLCGGNDGLLLRDAATGAVIRTFDFGNGRLSAAVSPDGRFVAGRHYDNGVAIFDLMTGERVSALPTARSQANIAFSADSKSLLAVLDGARKQVTVSGFLNGGSRAIGFGFNQEITFFTLTADGRALLAVGGSRCLLFGMGDGQPDDGPNIGGGEITAASFAGGQSLTLLGHSSGSIGIGVLTEPDPDRFKLQLTRILPDVGGGRVHDIALSPDGRLFATRSPACVNLFRIAAGQTPVPIAVFTGIGGVDIVARPTLLFAKDGRSFVAAGYQGIFRGDVSAFSIS